MLGNDKWAYCIYGFLGGMLVMIGLSYPVIETIKDDRFALFNDFKQFKNDTAIMIKKDIDNEQFLVSKISCEELGEYLKITNSLIPLYEAQKRCPDYILDKSMFDRFQIPVKETSSI